MDFLKYRGKTFVNTNGPQLNQDKKVLRNGQYEFFFIVPYVMCLEELNIFSLTLLYFILGFSCLFRESLFKMHQLIVTIYS